MNCELKAEPLYFAHDVPQASPLILDRPILQPGATCAVKANAPRAAVLVDGSNFFPAMRSAIENARRSVLLIGWDFDPHVELEPPVADQPPKRLAEIFAHLLSCRPGVTLKILIWDMAFAYAMQRRDSPQRAARRLPTAVQFRLDARHPIGASHHQKLLIVDDAIAFCGGADFTRNRWDTPAHADNDLRRRTADGRIYKPRHEVMIAVDGEAARALGDVARQRWTRAVGEPLEPCIGDSDPWPKELHPDLVNATVGISRTMPAHQGQFEIREIEALYLRAIEAARQWIYIENQYVTSPVIENALARRLAESGGPEVLIVCPRHSGGPADRFAMDRARSCLFERLHRADRYRRFRAVAALSAAGEPIMIHSKVMVVDEHLLRVGSANLNNRSLGLDTECDVCIESPSADATASGGVRDVLMRLLGEHIGCSPEVAGRTLARTGRLFATIDELQRSSHQRLARLPMIPPTAVDRIVGRSHLFDPFGASDNWRPWRRV